MTGAAVAQWRLNVESPWQPGGVAIVTDRGFSVKFLEVQDAAPAAFAFRSGLAQVSALIEGGATVGEALERFARSGYSGYHLNLVLLEIPETTTLAELYRHYVTEGRVALLPGAGSLQTDLPFG